MNDKLEALAARLNLPVEVLEAEAIRLLESLAADDAARMIEALS